MRFRKGLSVLLSIGLTLSMVTPCFAEETVSAESAVESVTADSLIDQYMQKSKEVSSITGKENLALSLKMAVFGEEMSIKMDMLFDIESTEDISHLTGEMNMVQKGTSEEDNAEESMQMEMYSVKEDTGYSVYTRDIETDTWSKSVLNELEFNTDLTDLVRGESFTLSDDTVDVDGTECYEVKGTMSLAGMMEYLGDSMEGLDEILPVDEDMDPENYNLDAVYCFDVDSQDLVSMKMDGSAMLEKLFKDMLVKSFSEMGAGSTEDNADDSEIMEEIEAAAEEAVEEASSESTEGEAAAGDPGFDVDALLSLFKIEIPEFAVEVNNIEYNTIDAIEIPEEALAIDAVGGGIKPGEDGNSGSGEEVNTGSDEDGTSEPGGTGGTNAFVPVKAVDNEKCSIVLEDIDPNGEWGYTIYAELENKTADQTFMYSIENAYVNGLENDPYFAAEVAPGKKAKETIEFEKKDEYGLTDFSDIEMLFRVYDSDDWSADPVAQEDVHVYPNGEENSEQFVYEPADTDQVLYDDDNCTVIFTGASKDEVWGYVVNLYIANKSDKNIMLSADDVSVNGYMADPYFAHTLGAGKSTFTEMSWSDSDLEESGITEVEEIEFTLTAYDDDDWSADELLHEVITLTV